MPVDSYLPAASAQEPLAIFEFPCLSAAAGGSAAVCEKDGELKLLDLP